MERETLLNESSQAAQISLKDFTQGMKGSAQSTQGVPMLGGDLASTVSKAYHETWVFEEDSDSPHLIVDQACLIQIPRGKTLTSILASCRWKGQGYGAHPKGRLGVALLKRRDSAGHAGKPWHRWYWQRRSLGGGGEVESHISIPMRGLQSLGPSSPLFLSQWPFSLLRWREAALSPELERRPFERNTEVDLFGIAGRVRENVSMILDATPGDHHKSYQRMLHRYLG